MADSPQGSARPAKPAASNGPVVERCESLSVLSRTAYYLLSVDKGCRLVVAQRSATPFQHISDIDECFQEVERILAPIPRQDYLLLVDVRNGPSRNDPNFETVVGFHRGKLLRGFAQNAALAASATGRLQIQRYAKTDRRTVFATDNEAAAFQYLGLVSHALL
jgi:hypothetical protein